MGKLQEKMGEEMILRGFAKNTMDSYLRQCRSYAKYFMRSPADMGREEIRRFLLYLMQEEARRVSEVVNSVGLLAPTNRSPIMAASRPLAQCSVSDFDQIPSKDRNSRVLPYQKKFFALNLLIITGIKNN